MCIMPTCRYVRGYLRILFFAYSCRVKRASKLAGINASARRTRGGDADESGSDEDGNSASPIARVRMQHVPVRDDVQ